MLGNTDGKTCPANRHGRPLRSQEAGDLLARGHLATTTLDAAQAGASFVARISAQRSFCAALTLTPAPSVGADSAGCALKASATDLPGSTDPIPVEAHADDGVILDHAVHH